MHVLFCSHAFTKEIYRYILRNLMSKHSKASACQLVELGEIRSSIIHIVLENWVEELTWTTADGLLPLACASTLWFGMLDSQYHWWMRCSSCHPPFNHFERNTCRTGPNMHVYEVERQSLLVEPQEIPSEESSRYRRIVKVIICRPKKQSHCSWGIS